MKKHNFLTLRYTILIYGFSSAILFSFLSHLNDNSWLIDSVFTLEFLLSFIINLIWFGLVGGYVYFILLKFRHKE